MQTLWQQPSAVWSKLPPIWLSPFNVLVGGLAIDSMEGGTVAPGAAILIGTQASGSSNTIASAVGDLASVFVGVGLIVSPGSSSGQSGSGSSGQSSSQSGGGSSRGRPMMGGPMQQSRSTESASQPGVFTFRFDGTSQPQSGVSGSAARSVRSQG